MAFDHPSYVYRVRSVMRHVVLITALLANVAHSFNRKEEVDKWLRDDMSSSRLSGVDLSVLVPEPLVPDHTYAYDRFGVRTLLRSIMDTSSGRKASPPSQVFADAYEPQATDNYKLGEAYLWGLTGIRDPVRAFEHYKLAANDGDADAQFMVGVGYATGFLCPNITVDPAKAVLYYTFAAEAGSVQALMALAYRYDSGLNVPVDTERSEQYYARAAEQCYAWHMTDFPLLPAVGRNAWAFGAEFNDGLYGDANYIAPMFDKYFRLDNGPVSLAKMMINRDWKTSMPRTVDDAVEKLKFEALDDKNWYAYYMLARLYRLGLSLSIPEPNLVAENLEECLALDPPDETVGVVNGFLAWMHIEGGGSASFPRQNLEAARRHVNIGLEKSPKSATCREAKAVIDYLEGNTNESLETLSALKKNQHGHIGGMIYALSLIQNGEPEKARKILEEIINLRTPAAYILLASLFDENGTEGVDTERHSRKELLRKGCMTSEDFVSPIRFAQYAYARGDTGGALLAFAVSAELGYEAAAINIADLLDTKHSRFKAIASWPLPRFTMGLNRAKEALKWFMRAAPYNVDALAKAADYMLDEDSDPFQAMQYLRTLARSGLGMAYWKLGWLYEYGHGLMKPDYYLALRFYDWSKETPSASLGIMIATIRLRFKLWWSGTSMAPHQDL